MDWNPILNWKILPGSHKFPTMWQPIEVAIKIAESNDGWIPRSLFDVKREWGWEMWVGQCDAGDIWLGRTGHGSCFDTDTPTHWMPLAALADPGDEEFAKYLNAICNT